MINDSLKVFILEDLKTDLELLKRQVLKYNDKSTFTTANNRESFLEKIAWMQPDLILSDYNLPDFNGLEALLHVKQHMPDVPFIFVTATLNNEESVARTILQGANGFVSKQNLKAIPKVIKEVLEKTSARIEAAKIKAEEARQKKILLGKLEGKISQLEKSPDQQEILEIIKKLQTL